MHRFPVDPKVIDCIEYPMGRLFPLFVLLLALPALAEMNPEWTAPLPPFQIADNLYYVGSQDLAAYLVTTPAGNILINANLESSPPLIRASVEKLGFQWADTKILLNGQAHFDHMGGAAQILRETHAKNMVMEGDSEVVESGGRSDFLSASGSVPPYPPAQVDRILHDGDTAELGGVTDRAQNRRSHPRLHDLDFSCPSSRRPRRSVASQEAWTTLDKLNSYTLQPVGFIIKKGRFKKLPLRQPQLSYPAKSRAAKC